MVCGSHNHPRHYLIRHQGPNSHVVAMFPLLGNPHTVSLHTTKNIPNPLDREIPQLKYQADFHTSKYILNLSPA